MSNLKDQKGGDFDQVEKQQLEKEVIFLKKRLDQCKKENDILKKDNKVLRDEMSSLKDTVKNIALARPKTAVEKNTKIQNEDQLRFVLEYQRKRLDEVEKELDTYKNKYESILYQNQRNAAANNNKINVNSNESMLSQSQQSVRPESVFLAEQYSQSTEQVMNLRKVNEQLEDKIKLITTQYSQEMASLKSKLAKQDAIIFTNNNNNTNNNSKNNNFNNSTLSNSNYNNINSNNSSLGNNYNAVNSLNNIISSSSSSFVSSSRSKINLDPLLNTPSKNGQQLNNNYSYNSNATQFQTSSSSSNNNNNYKSQRQPSLSQIKYDNNNDSIFTYKKKNN